MKTMKVGKGLTAKVITPDIGDNLKLPEGERFQIELKRPSKWKMQDRAVRPIMVNGEVEIEVQQRAMVEVYIERLVNPFDIDIDGEKTRKVRVSDLFEYDELYTIIDEIRDAVAEMGEGEEDAKN